MPILTSARPQEPPFSGDDPLVIGLVNNMPDGALRNTEQNFLEVLAAASQDIPIQVRMLFLPEVSRSAAAHSHMAESYEDVAELWGSRLDGLIVTGTEPRAPDLAGEVLWAPLTKLVDWAARCTSSTIWSCLAAHVAVFYLDGVNRHRRGKKLSGVFGCDVAGDHVMVADLPTRWVVPHSRWNELRHAELVDNGYTILSNSAEAGVDLFVKEKGSLFVFLQGHPEYDSTALLREYRRDVGRYLAGHRDDYPEMPRNYFDESAMGMLSQFREQALLKRNIDLLESFPGMPDEQPSECWRNSAVRMYRNWLLYLSVRRDRDSGRGSRAVFDQPRVLAEGVA